MAPVLGDNQNLERRRGKSMLLYQQIKRNIGEVIESKNYKSGDRLPPISQMVRTWNVDPRTVKNALKSLEDDGVVKWQPCKGAVVLKGSRKKVTMGFVRFSPDAFLTNLLDGMLKYCNETQNQVHVLDGANSHKQILDYINNVPSYLDGLVALPFETPEYHNAALSAVEKGRNIVFVDRRLDDCSVSSVCVDHFSGAYQAVCHLIDEHKKPVYYIGFRQPSSCENWVKGWLHAMHHYGFDGLDDYFVEVSSSESDTSFNDIYKAPYETAMDLFSRKQESTYSIFAGSDHTAKAVYRACENSGLKVGKDVFIVGFGDLPLAKTLIPKLSTVKHDAVSVGYHAARVLDEQLQGNDTIVHHVIPAELIVRQSSVR